MELFADFFDALRRMSAKRTASPAQSQDHQAAPPLPSLPSPTGGWRVGPAGIALIKQFEGCARRRADGRFEAYPDPGTGADPWGATGTGIRRGTVWSQAQCDARLEADLARYAAEVARALGNAPTTQHQFDALVSFHYNTGAIAKAAKTIDNSIADAPISGETAFASARTSAICPTPMAARTMPLPSKIGRSSRSSSAS